MLRAAVRVRSFALARASSAALALPRRTLSATAATTTTTIPAMSDVDTQALQRIRNIGILAHIDAGKTTTTERMLFYAGAITRMGEVHDGDATMDFMPQERERGITIGAAAISFDWQQHQINLIDTPGHVDFTVEVERAVRVLDGAVAVLDGVAGVEAQTETVWAQADRYNLPRLCFVNKLDRDGASFERACASLEARFGVTTLRLQLPVGEESGFEGVVDLVSMTLVRYLNNDGTDVQTLPLVATAATGSRMAALFEKASAARQQLIERASDFDDVLAELFLLEEPVDAATLQQALRRIAVRRTNATTAILTLGGSALKNKGVQPLLDAIVAYLPSPLDVSPFDAQLVQPTKRKAAAAAASSKEPAATLVQRHVSPNEPLVALAFKVQHDRQRGLVVFFRVYAGVLHAKSQLLNTTRGGSGTTERVTRLLRVAADDTDDVESISAGSIGAAVGLKHTFTGDTLVAAKDVSGSTKPLVVLPGVQVPAPVFTCSIEAESSAKQKDLEDALRNLEREDPSFVVSVDDETGQTLMSGMGELHLEILQERLRTDYKLNPTIGAMRVAYLESIGQAVTIPYTYDTVLGTVRQFAQLTIRLTPQIDVMTGERVDNVDNDGIEATNTIEWLHASDNKVPHAFVLAIDDGVRAALSRGVVGTTSHRVAFVHVVIDARDVVWDADSNANAFRVAAMLSVKQALGEAAPAILEPVMKLVVQTPDRTVGDVLSDLTSQRRALIQEVGAADDATPNSSRPSRSVVLAHVPLAHMVGYATLLRSKTQGEGSFSIEFLKYVEVDAATRDRMTGASVRRLAAQAARRASESEWDV